jgi:uncharacterized protein YggU (UPF0235/DUF167 family)
VRVTARAASNRIRRETAGIRVSVTAPAVDNQANEAVIAVLAKALRLPKSSFVIERGKTSRDKLIAVSGITQADLDEKLEEW